MTELRIKSISGPIAESPETVRWVLATVYRADLMDLLPKWVDENREIVLDEAFLREFAAVVGNAGIGRGLTINLDHDLTRELSRAHLAETMQSIWQVLDDSPYPAGEWGGVRDRLGDEQLAELLDISTSSLRRYASGVRETPDEIAWRLHTLTRIIAALSGSYNDYGVRRWFQRPRAQLDGQTPAEVFTEAGGEDDEQLNSLVELAEALVGPALAV
jgi:hypothetical protein